MIMQKPTPYSKRGMRVFSNFSSDTIQKQLDEKNLSKSEIFNHPYDNIPLQNSNNDEIYLQSSRAFNKKVNQNKLSKVINQQYPKTSRNSLRYQDIADGSKTLRNNSILQKYDKELQKKNLKNQAIDNSNRQSHTSDNNSALSLLNSINLKIEQKPKISSYQVYNSKEYEKLLNRNSQLTQKINKVYIQKSEIFSQNMQLSRKNCQLANQLQSLKFQLSSTTKTLTRTTQKQHHLQKQKTSLQLQIYKIKSEMDYYKNKYQDQFHRNQAIMKENIEAQKDTKQLKKIKQVIWGNNNQKQIGKQIDCRQTIQQHLKYEMLIAQLQAKVQYQIELRKRQVQTFKRKQQIISQQLQKVYKQINKKIKELTNVKTKLQQQLNASKQQTEKLRKYILKDFQQMINQKHNKIIELKQANLTLQLNSTNKSDIIRAQNEASMLRNQNKNLVQKNKQLQQACERLKIFAQDCQKNYSQFQAQTTVKSMSVCGFDALPTGQMENLLASYQKRLTDFDDIIKHKAQQQQYQNKRIENLQKQLQEAKNRNILQNRKNKSDENNTKNQVQSLKMELKSETESLNRKINSLQGTLKRKNNQIKEKDDFIVRYLLPKVKGDKDASQILHEIQKYFNNESLQTNNQPKE